MVPAGATTTGGAVAGSAAFCDGGADSDADGREPTDVDPQANWRPLKGHLSPAAIEALAKAYSGRGVAAFGLYESTIHTWNPETRRAIRAAGWNYDPQKPAASRQP